MSNPQELYAIRLKRFPGDLAIWVCVDCDDYVTKDKATRFTNLAAAKSKLKSVKEEVVKL